MERSVDMLLSAPKDRVEGLLVKSLTEELNCLGHPSKKCKI